MSKDIPLSEDLKYWRAERPDEWTMDRFIRKATTLEGLVTGYLTELCDLYDEIDRLKVYNEWLVDKCVSSMIADGCLKEDGSIDFHTYHYNGGAHWTEIIEDTLMSGNV